MTLNVSSIFPLNSAQDEYWQSQAEQGIRGKYVSKTGSSVITGIDTFGYIGSTATTTSTIQDTVDGTYFILKSPGSITTITAYVNGRSGYSINSAAGVWRYAPGSELLGSTAASNLSYAAGGPYWKTYTSTNNILLEPGSYVLGIATDTNDNGKFYYVSGTSEPCGTDRSANMSDTFPISTPWVGGAGDFTTDYRYCIYSDIPTETQPTITDEHLWFKLESKSLYNFEFNIGIKRDSTIPNMLINFSIPAGASGKYWITGDPIDLSTYTTLTTTTSTTWYTIFGYVNTATTSGKLQLNYKQSEISQSAITMEKDSWATLTKN